MRTTNLAAAVALATLAAQAPAVATLPARAVSRPGDTLGFSEVKPDANGVRRIALVGERARAGVFVERVLFPAGYKGHAHRHNRDFYVVILAGALRFGYGETADDAAAQPLGPGSFVMIPANAAHFESVVEDTVIQVPAEGPFATAPVRARHAR